MKATDLERAAELVARADAILVAAGAGMGVDSGLPDFRGDEGFWRAYPPFRRLGLSFVDMANPAWFERDAALAWGFYGHRLHLYRDTDPHEGFQVLRRWVADAGEGFVFTSNVDGHFQKAGFEPERIVECHGSLNHLQAVDGCSEGIWSARGASINVDPESFRASEPLPSSPRGGGLARPNVLMFGDWAWCSDRTGAQEQRFERWLGEQRGRRMVIVECGAGSAVPTVRMLCERIARGFDAPLIRINPREPDGPPGTISLAAGAARCLEAIDAAYRRA